MHWSQTERESWSSNCLLHQPGHPRNRSSKLHDQTGRKLSRPCRRRVAWVTPAGEFTSSFTLSFTAGECYRRVGDISGRRRGGAGRRVGLGADGGMGRIWVGERMQYYRVSGGRLHQRISARLQKVKGYDGRNESDGNRHSFDHRGASGEFHQEYCNTAGRVVALEGALDQQQ